MDVYIGLDVSLASTAICAVSAQGKIVKETTAASEPETLVATLKAMPGTRSGVAAARRSSRMDKNARPVRAFGAIGTTGMF